MSATKLQEQWGEFQAVLDETEKYGAKVTSFFKQMYDICEQRIKDGSVEELSEVHLKALSFQRKQINLKMNELSSMPTKAGGVTIEEEKKEEPPKTVISFAPGYVQDACIVFADSTELGWIPGNGNLLDDHAYMFEMKTTDGVARVTNAREAGIFDGETFTKSGKDNKKVSIPTTLFNTSAEGVTRPQVDPMFYIEPHVEIFFDAIVGASKFRPQNVLISGPQGTGKTTLAQQIAAKNNMGFFQMSCGMVESPAEWFGFRDVRDKELIYVRSAFVDACETPNTIILLDEFNRLHSSLQNGLYNILDDNGAAWVDFIKRYIRVANGVIFLATVNLGGAHTGTFAIDAAMEDRFSFHLKLNYLPEGDEVRTLINKTNINKATAQKLVKVAQKVREGYREESSEIGKPISFRQLQAAGSLINAGMKPRQAVEVTILSKFSDDGGDSSEQAAVLKIFQGLFGSSSA